MSKKLSATERLDALAGALEWVGTYDAGSADDGFITIADGATAEHGAPQDLVNAYALLTELMEQERQRALVATYRKAVRARFAAADVQPTVKQVNEMAALAMNQ